MSRTKLPPQVLATRAEIEAIYQRADESLERLVVPIGIYDFDRATERERDARVRDALEALRFCATAAAALGDPSLVPLVIDVIERLEPFDAPAGDDRSVTAEALGRLLSGGLAADKRIRALAADPDPRFRAAIARGLSPEGEDERELLRTLAADPEVHVRDIAKKALAAVAPLPWWAGKWKSDPAARRRPGVAATAGPALAAAGALLDCSREALLKEGGKLPELLAALEKLPDELVVEAVELFFGPLDRYAIWRGAPLFHACLAREGGAPAFLRLIDGWGGVDETTMIGAPLVAAVRSAPEGPRRAACEALLRRAASAPAEERDDIRSAARLAADIAARAWPADGDVTAVLEALLGLSGEESPPQIDFVRSTLAGILDRADVDPTPILDRVIEAQEAAFPPPWRALRSTWNAVIARAPRDVLRRLAERALGSEDDAAVSWALEQLLGPAFDPALDGAPPARAAALFAEPRLRRLILDDMDLARRALPRLREELRACTLTYAEAVVAMQAIHDLWGGLADVSRAMVGDLFDEDELPEAEEERKEQLRQVAPWLGPADTQGPPTSEDWRGLRAAAAREPAGPRPSDWTRTLSAGPWTAEERAELDAQMAALGAGERRDGYHIALALTAKPDAALLPLFEEIAAGQEGRRLAAVRAFEATARKALGLPELSRRAEGDGAEDGGDDLPGGAWDDGDDE